jgi:hypothetical protein
MTVSNAYNRPNELSGDLPAQLSGDLPAQILEKADEHDR